MGQNLKTMEATSLVVAASCFEALDLEPFASASASASASAFEKAAAGEGGPWTSSPENP
jgi:hypothetical protein